MPDIKNTNIQEILQRLQVEDPDLYAISQNETSGGQNLNHSPVTSGVNKGHTAGGAWGMMPITAKEIVGRNRELGSQYPQIESADPETLTKAMNEDPYMAYALAKSEYDRRLKLMDSDKSKAVYSWLNGITGTKNAMPEDIESSDYVQKFLKHLPTKVTQK